MLISVTETPILKGIGYYKFITRHNALQKIRGESLKWFFSNVYPVKPGYHLSLGHLMTIIDLIDSHQYIATKPTHIEFNFMIIYIF